ncbi:hypothetical protein [Sedimentitalea nanhaiensis]|uniref:Uncharacterized protein n=1 Tax=Sedimentitalea nanhaiensis TaxID=999627 RepID=A0A1I7CBC2_9RHOB|nr:hypothetical protein [Sedimentitalea nanhaiensis]SFT96703.1 hypothetical protein SAMN05216236_115103 [Sedimentitalea nanhaiensis]
MARWFVVTRGSALPIVTLGFTVGEARLPVAFVAAMAAMAVMDWHLLWLVAAMICMSGVPCLDAPFNARIL